MSRHESYRHPHSLEASIKDVSQKIRTFLPLPPLFLMSLLLSTHPLEEHPSQNRHLLLLEEMYIGFKILYR